jgi:hypothetical protein
MMQLVVVAMQLVMVLEDFSFHMLHIRTAVFLSLTTTDPALTAAAVTDIKKQTASKIPSIFFICFNIFLSPSLFLSFIQFKEILQNTDVSLSNAIKSDRIDNNT